MTMPNFDRSINVAERWFSANATRLSPERYRYRHDNEVRYSSFIMTM